MKSLILLQFGRYLFLAVEMDDLYGYEGQECVAVVSSTMDLALVVFQEEDVQDVYSLKTTVERADYPTQLER